MQIDTKADSNRFDVPDPKAPTLRWIQIQMILLRVSDMITFLGSCRYVLKEEGDQFETQHLREALRFFLGILPK